jgi:hypothetical protein
MESEKRDDVQYLTVDELAFRWRCQRDAIARRIKRGLIKAFHLPVQSSRRKREYLTRLISMDEVLRIERLNTGHE